MVRIYLASPDIIIVTQDAEDGRIIHTAIDVLGLSGFLNKLGRNESGYYYYSEIVQKSIRVVFE